MIDTFPQAAVDYRAEIGSTDFVQIDWAFHDDEKADLLQSRYSTEWQLTPEEESHKAEFAG